MPTSIIDDDGSSVDIVEEEGCCKHDIEHGHKREILIHPIVHTANVFGFILVITLILNYCLSNVVITDFIEGSKYIQPVIGAFIGLIPNCGASVSGNTCSYCGMDLRNTDFVIDSIKRIVV